MLASTLALLHLEVTELEQQLQDVVEMTGLTSLTLEVIPGSGIYVDGFPAGDKLTLLQSLADLQTLHLLQFQQPNMDLQRLQSLRKLIIDDCYTACYDMTSCTQITSIDIACSDAMYTPARVLLPTGSNVQLQPLSITAEDDFKLRNLQDASQLTSMEFNCTYPLNCMEASKGLPTFMPCLNTIKALMVQCLPRPQLARYSQLRHLVMTICHMDPTIVALPNWCSQLTQLDTLRVHVVNGLSNFPKCLLELKQLSSLNLASSDFHLKELPDQIFRFSEFTALTHLDSRPPYAMAYGANAHQKFLCLQSLMSPDVLLY
ncbi:hypothetical protein ABBQ38_005722 [Trebouxia sp. C0009 RCD-2024]